MDSTGHISVATINASNLSSGTFGSNTGGGNYSFSGTVTGSQFNGSGAGLTGTAGSLTAGAANSVTFNGGLTTGSGPTFNTVYTGNWFRSSGQSGWYNSDYAVGVYATTAGRVDLYNGAGLYVPGNVGIGTASPGYKLDVAGAVRSSSGGFVYPDGTTQTSAATSYWTASGSNIYNNNAGNVGIGTTSPGYTLDVNGSARINGAGIYNSAGYQLVETNATDWTRWNQGGGSTNGNAMYQSLSLGSGGLAVGTWSNQGTGNIYLTGYMRGGDYGFGGFYAIWGCGWGAQVNPFTGGYSCPSGFSAWGFTAANWAGGGCNANLNVTLCYK